MEEKDFIQFAKDAEDPNRRLTSLKQQFEKGEKAPEFLKNLAGLTIYNDPEFAGKVLDRYFGQKTALDQEDVQLLLSGVQTTESPLYKIFQNKKEDIQKFFPADRYEKFDKNIKLNTVAKKSLQCRYENLE